MNAGAVWLGSGKFWEEEAMLKRDMRTKRDMTILGGWLFADLLLAFMVIFLAAQPPYPKTPPKAALAAAVTPTPTPEPRLDFTYQRFRMDNVDYNGILNNDPAAVTAVEQFITGQAVLHNRSAGLVVVYDGAQNDAQIADAQSIAQAVISHVLKVMGRQGPLFQRTSYYNPLYLFGPSHSTVVFDVYLFRQ